MKYIDHKVPTSNTKTFTSKMKKEMQGWLNASLNTETRDELSTTSNPKVMSRCLSAPDAIYIPTSLPPEPSSILYYLKSLDTKGP